MGFRLVIAFVAVTVAVLTFGGIVSMTSEAPVVEETLVVLPAFAGGPIHPGSWEEKPAEYGATFEESGVSQPASGYGRTFEETARQRG